jgi:hypothetical protein
MRKFIVTVVLGFCAVAARADNIVIAFSGSGSSGTITPGGQWVINANSTDSWGIPGYGDGAINWPGPGGEINDLTITFSGLPTGVEIDELSSDECTDDATGLCDVATGTAWTGTISDGGAEVTFTAPDGTYLGAGDPFFVNVLFSGDEGTTVTFTGGWSSPVPEPSSVILLLTTLLAVAFVARKRIARGKA